MQGETLTTQECEHAWAKQYPQFHVALAVKHADDYNTLRALIAYHTLIKCLLFQGAKTCNQCSTKHCLVSAKISTRTIGLLPLLSSAYPTPSRNLFCSVGGTPRTDLVAVRGRGRRRPIAQV